MTMTLRPGAATLRKQRSRRQVDNRTRRLTPFVPVLFLVRAQLPGAAPEMSVRGEDHGSPARLPAYATAIGRV